MRLTKEELANEIKDRLMEKLPEGSEVQVREVNTTRGTYTGICTNIPSDERLSISPVINMDAIYDQYEKSGNAEEAIDGAVNLFDESLSADGLGNIQQQITAITSFGEASKMMYLSVLPPAVKNDLDDIPHMDIEDIHLGVKLLMSDVDDNIATITVRNTLLESWGVSEDEMFKAAEENSLKIRPTQITPMIDILSSMMPEEMIPELNRDADMTPGFYVLTTNVKTDGAGAFFAPGMMEDIAAKMKGDYYMLPSSVHEVLILPADAMSDINDIRNLSQMVREVNSTQLDIPAEKMSDHAFHYDVKEKTLETVEDYVEHLEKEATKDEEMENEITAPEDEHPSMKM